VRGVLSARVAEFLCLHPVGMLLFILGRRVIPVLAVIALQSDNFAHSAAS
jgi:hypothetical protein